ncbi:hypothetical protein [Desulfolucanica intricata]|uniref:hypothetical protein n=1 Tax=Desulfolucanica intricata TaxID=1285191 RepID=UPI000B12DFC4|nr:hypothetical protein [Desulfolucanica intricata]
MPRCIMCGKVFEVEDKKDPYEEEEDMPKKTPSFCQMCEAKLRHEADQSQKIPKPM